MSSSYGVLYTKDLLNLTVDDVMTRSGFKVEDPSNLTEEHLDHMRKLACQRDQIALTSAVNASELKEKLRNVSSRSTSPASTVVPDPPEPEEVLRARKEDYDALIQEGGIPYYYDPEDYSEPWPRATGYEDTPWSTAGLYSQLEDWRKFRKFQQKVREDPERFSRYQKSVHEYRQEKGLEGDVQLHRDLERQTKLDNWKEYHAYKHYKKLQLERAVKRAQELEAVEKRFEAAESEEAREEARDWVKRYGVGIYPSSAKRELKEWNTMIDWIEQQLRTIASESASLTDISKGRQSFNKHNRPTRRPVLGPILSPKISKATRKTKPRLCKQGNVSHNTLLSPGEQGLKMKLPPVPSAPLRRSDRISKLWGNAMAQSSAATSLSPIHSLKVSKAAGRTASRGTQSSTQRRANNTKPRPSVAIAARPQNEQKKALDALTSTSKRTSCAIVTLRRSRRISDRVEKLYASS